MVALNGFPPVHATTFRVEPHVSARETRLDLTGELDLATAPLFGVVLAFALDPRPAVVVLDLEALAFIDVRGATSVGTAATRVAAWGGTLVARDPQRIVRRVFDLCGLGGLLTPRTAVVPAHRPERPRIEPMQTSAALPIPRVA